MKATRYSKQREAILIELQHRTDHPTADQVYSTLKITHPELSLGTVYRNLNFLAQQGDILKLDVGDGTCHYDGNTHNHIHYICKCCRKIIDIEFTSALEQQIYQDIDYDIDQIQLILSGTCPECKKNESN